MNTSQVLDVAIGLVITFVIVSILASAIVEGISIMLKKRSKDLESVIRAIVSNPPTASTQRESESDHSVSGTGSARPDAIAIRTLDVYATSVFRGFEIAARRKRGPRSDRDQRSPSYVSARSFANAVIEDLATAKDVTASTSDQVFAVAARLPDNSPIRARLLSLISEVHGDINAVKSGLEAWFDDTMDRLSGSYKRWSKWLLVVIGVALALAINISAIRVVTTLWADGPVRSAVASSADVYAQQHQSGSFKGMQDAITDLDALQLPVGWDDGWGRGGPIGYVVGALIIGFAVMLGAPFWFDLLTKLLGVRSGGGGVPPRATDDPASATSAKSAAATSSMFASAAPLEGALARFVDALPHLALATPATETTSPITPRWEGPK